VASSLALVLMISLFYILMCFKLYDRKTGFSGTILEGLLETSYIVIGMATLGWCILT